MSFTIMCAVFCHPGKVLSGFQQHQSTAASEDGVGRIILPLSSLVLRFLPFSHLPSTQQLLCTDEVGSFPFGGMRFPLISCILFLSALWSCQWSASINPGPIQPNSALWQQQECFLVSSLPPLFHQLSLLLSLGEKPPRLPSPASPLYGWKGPLPHLLLPALFCFQAISGENGNIVLLGRSS